MKYSKAQQGRVFVLRLEDGEIIHETIERFAKEQVINAAALIILGGVDAGSRLVVGPEEGNARPVTPLEHVLDDVHEIAGIGTLFPDEDGNPVLHMHIACGRKTDTCTGCIRSGVKTWNLLEVIVYEIADSTGKRIFNSTLGFQTLEP